MQGRTIIFLIFVLGSIRLVSMAFMHLLRRILRRLAEVVVCDLQVVLLCHRHAVADPVGRDMDRGFVCAAQVLSQLGPRLDTRSIDVPKELGPKVHGLPGSITSG